MKLRIAAAGLFIALTALAAGCAGPGRSIYRVYGCNHRLFDPAKREDCRVCLTRPRPHVFLPENPAGMRCQFR